MAQFSLTNFRKVFRQKEIDLNKKMLQILLDN